MGAQLNSLVSDYYENHKGEDISEEDALTVMKAFEQRIVDEVIREHAERVATEEAAARENQLQKERDERLQESIRSFSNLIIETVFLATIVGLIGSHLYGIGEAWWYAPNEGFNIVASVIALVILLYGCHSLVKHMFLNNLPDWVADAVRHNHDK